MLLSESQEMVRDMVRRFAGSELAPKAAELDRSGRFPTEAVAAMGPLGLMGMAVPELWGGAGADYVSLALAVEEIAVADGGVAIVMSTHNALMCWPLLAYGTDAQKEKYLKPMARGELLGGFSMTEASGGSDPTVIKTRAVKKGDSYVLNGVKQFVTNGSNADLLIVLAATDVEAGSRGFSFFLVPKDAPGYRVARVEDKLGIRNSGTAQIVFEDVAVTAADMVGAPGQGYRIALETLTGSRIGVAAQAVGLARAGLEAALAYAKERTTFGKPITEHQAVAFKLADMATGIETARQMTLHTASLRDAGLPFQKESSMAKLYAAEMAERVCSDALQIHGGYGYLTDFPVERFYRDARVTQIYEGTNEVQRMVISRAILKE